MVTQPDKKECAVTDGFGDEEPDDAVDADDQADDGDD